MRKLTLLGWGILTLSLASFSNLPPRKWLLISAALLPIRRERTFQARR